MYQVFGIRSSHSNYYEDYSLLGCDAMLFGTNLFYFIYSHTQPLPTSTQKVTA